MKREIFIPVMLVAAARPAAHAQPSSGYTPNGVCFEALLPNVPPENVMAMAEAAVRAAHMNPSDRIVVLRTGDAGPVS